MKGDAVSAMGGRAALAGVVVFGAIALALPEALTHWDLGPDATGYVATAYNWIEGRGFVDPIVYSYFVEDLRPPAPALAIRSPLVSVLFALPLLLGATLAQLVVLHVIGAGLIAGAGLLVARRSMSGPAALGFAIAMGWSSAWIHHSRILATEVTAVGVILLTILLIRRAVSSIPMAMVFAGVTIIAWLTRPVLGLVFPAAVLCGLAELGPRRALRSAPFWTYVASFTVLAGATLGLVQGLTGQGLYAHYGLMWELLDARDAAVYGHDYAGKLAFIAENLTRILGAVQANASSYVRYMFREPAFLHLGWLVVPGLLFGLSGSTPGSIERRFAAVLGIGLTAAGLLVYCSFDVVRYSLPGAVCLWFVVMAMLDRGATGLSRRVGKSQPRPTLQLLIRMSPLLVVLALFTIDAPSAVERSWKAWQRHQEDDAPPRRTHWDKAAVALGPYLHPDAVVASPNPWRVYRWTGNAGLWIPRNLDREHLDAFLDDMAPGYLINDQGALFELLEASPRLQRLATYRDSVLYEVVDPAPESRPWKAPRPLAQIGTATDP
jgi:hypothetical protein